MSLLQRIGQWLGHNPEASAAMVKATMEKLYGASVQDLLQEAIRWQPVPTQCGFREEMDARLSYLNGSMQADMLAVLLRRFPMGHLEIDKEQVNLRIFQKQIRDQAKVFADPGQIHLYDKESGEDLEAKDPQQKALNDMLKRGRFSAVLRDIDRVLHAIHRLGAKLWWDAKRKCVRVAIWEQQFVHWAPNPDQYWDSDECFGVALEWPGTDGMNIGARYEVWTKRRVEDGWAGATYMTGYRETKNEKSKEVRRDWWEKPVGGNEEMKLPFYDPETEEPIYPLTWWQDDTNLALYWIGDEDSLTINRMLNAALTDVNHGMLYGQHPIMSWETDKGSEAASPPKIMVGPGYYMAEAGIHPRFTHPNYDPQPAVELWAKLVDIESKIAGSAARGLTQDPGAPESGIAKKIENLPLEEHRNELIPIYDPHLVDMIRRALIVQNTYAAEAGLVVVDLVKNGIRWVPGNTSIPQDEEQETRIHAARREANVESAIEERMALTGEDEDKAKSAIEKNAKLNKELAKAGREEFSPFGRPPMPPGAPAPDEPDEENPEEIATEDEPKIPEAFKKQQKKLKE